MSKFVKLDADALKSLEYYMPRKEILQQMANFFSIFSDSTRLKILSALAIKEMCVSDISCSLDLNQTTVSHQLKLLKQSNAVSDKREGKVIFYSLANKKINDILLEGVDFLYEV